MSFRLCVSLLRGIAIQDMNIPSNVDVNRINDAFRLFLYSVRHLQKFILYVVKDLVLCACCIIAFLIRCTIRFGNALMPRCLICESECRDER